MHDPQQFLQDLALVLSVAAVVTVVFRLLRQPIVLGYLLAGIILGPHVPLPLFADQDRIQTLAELGVILVMFSVGLEFSIRRLATILPTSGLTGAIQLGGMFWLGYGVAQGFGWGTEESLFGGAMISISSTIIVARTFAEQKVDRRLSEIVFGVLVVQDLAGGVNLGGLPGVAAGRGAAPGAVLQTTAQLGAFLMIAVVLGFLVVPRGVRALFRLGTQETTMVACVGFCFAMSLLAHELGYSVALGAFLAGSLIAESGHGEEVEHMVVPLRDLFGAVFFVAIGMMVDPAVILEHWAVILVLTGLVLVGQSVLVALGTFLAGTDVRTSVRAGMSLAQIGEFSFIIAGIGVSAGVVRPFLYPVAVAVCLLTTFATPWMVRFSGATARAIDSRLPHPIQTFTSLYGSWREQLRQRPRRTFVVTLQLAMILLVGLPFLAVTRPFLPFWVGPGLLLAALAVLGLSFWRSARNLEEHVRAGAHLVLETLIGQAGQPRPQHGPLDQVSSTLPGLGALTAVRLEPSSPAVGKTLIDLDLRSLTGASVIAIGRDGGGVAAPTGREPLAVGDVLTLTGTSEAVAAAAALLAEGHAEQPAAIPA